MKKGKFSKYGDALRHYVAENTLEPSVAQLRDLLVKLISLQIEAFHTVHDINRKLTPRLLHLEVLNKRAAEACAEFGLVCIPQDLLDSWDEWPYNKGT